MQNTPLHAAAAGRHLEVIAILLAHGANVNARQQGGWTALHAAAQNGDVEIAKLLIAHGADAEARADNNQTPHRSSVDQRASGGSGSAGRSHGRAGSVIKRLCSIKKSNNFNPRHWQRIQSATNLDDLEAVRVDVLGRKGSLSQFSKNFGKLTPEERSSVGQALNAAKEGLESALDAKKQAFADAVQQARLKGEWIDLTLARAWSSAGQSASRDADPE